MKRINELEWQIVFVVLTVGTALAITLSGCDDVLNVTLKTRRAESFTECEAYCRATPIAVKFDRNGNLLECRCDVIFSEVE